MQGRLIEPLFQIAACILNTLQSCMIKAKPLKIWLLNIQLLINIKHDDVMQLLTTDCALRPSSETAFVFNGMEDLSGLRD